MEPKSGCTRASMLSTSTPHYSLHKTLRSSLDRRNVSTIGTTDKFSDRENLPNSPSIQRGKQNYFCSRVCQLMNEISFLIETNFQVNSVRGSVHFLTFYLMYSNDCLQRVVDKVVAFIQVRCLLLNIEIVEQNWRKNSLCFHSKNRFAFDYIKQTKSSI